MHDIATWPGAGFDVILANASLQWVPNHATLLPALIAKLSPGGTLAVQMPDNLEEPAHRLMRMVAAAEPFAAKLANAANARTARHSPAWYYEVLQDHAAQVDVWSTTYHHRLAGGASGIVEWFKGTGLRPFLDPLDAQECQAFLSRYEAELAQAYPLLPGGSVLLPFPRLFFVATRAV